MSAPLEGTIPFIKASACGNDFLIVEGGIFPQHIPRDLSENVSRDLSEISRSLCDRHNGVGADGVEWLFPAPDADAAARLINADGSEAEISGNGTRCVAASICSREGKAEVRVRTRAGIKTCRLVSQQGNSFEFEAEMGEPALGGQVSIAGEGWRAIGSHISMGNPHFVIFVDHFPEGWQREAALIGRSPRFPNGTNIEYVRTRGAGEIEIRLFERGVGETQSSGTGSCAAAVAAICDGRVVSPVTVVAPGGPQTVRWEGQVYLRGPATILCRGEFFV